MSASKPNESGEVRIEHSLNKNEGEFVVQRRKVVLQSLKKLQIQFGQDEVPNIALLGSGGGERAMVGLLGSLVQLQKTGLLDCILYLSGVSGSTWSMASLYQEPDWSTKLETVKEKIIQRLSGSGVSWIDAVSKLKKYYYGKDFFSLTDVWAVILVSTNVKEIDEHTLTEQWDQHRKDPFPIYTAIDKLSKQRQEGDPWFEITPHEAGYSLTGAFVDTSDFGSQFDNGHKKKQQDEFDMLYLQALCSSVLADEEEIWKWIKALLLPEIKKKCEKMRQDPNSPPVDECHQVLLNLVNMNLAVLKGADPSAFDKDIRTKLTDLSAGKSQLIFQEEKLNAEKIADKKAAKLYMEQYTMDVCNFLSGRFNFWPFDVCMSICRCVVQWIWGRTHNFLHNMTDEAVPAALVESETRDFEDAGLLLNSPFFSVLRKERDIDLIISLDFSDGEDPFTTVKEAAQSCKKLNIPFPEVNIASELSERPKDFYVFKGPNAPTVIHIPLFNMVNCGVKIEAWRSKYTTFQGPYSAEMIADLMKVAGRNIINNRMKLVEQIRAVTKAKWLQGMARQDSTL